ncbi:MAG: hypothetical protein JXR19_00275 [Bacteroidia bacterium]
MKLLTAIFLTLVISSGFIINLSTLVWYGVERSYIVQELCENREKKELECNGNCVLQKTMKLDQNNQNAENPELLVMKLLQFVMTTDQPNFQQEILKPMAPWVDYKILSKDPQGIFHPPRTLV